MRTVEEFVQESIKRGRSREEVREVAISTRWSGQTREVLETYDRLAQKTRSAA